MFNEDLPLFFTSPRLRGEVDPPKHSEGGSGEGHLVVIGQKIEAPLTRLAALATLSPQVRGEGS
jgi:hypothetical protein